MAAIMMYGRALARDIIQTMAGHFVSSGALQIISVGHDPASRVYIDAKLNLAEQLGVTAKHLRLPEETSPNGLIDAIETHNEMSGVSSLMVQLPMPRKWRKSQATVHRVLNHIARHKDVDGLSEQPPCLPATGTGILRLLEAYPEIPLNGQRIVLVGRTRVVNIQLGQWLARSNDVSYIVKGDSYDSLRQADIIVSATGVPGLIRPDMVKRGVVAIDVGAHVRDVAGKRVVSGDFDPLVSEVASYMTPVPYGVGPMTLAGLMLNHLHLTVLNHPLIKELGRSP